MVLGGLVFILFIQESALLTSLTVGTPTSNEKKGFRVFAWDEGTATARHGTVEGRNAEDMEDSMDEEEIEDVSMPSPPPQQLPLHKESLPRIVWLASFPNSGTSYTLTAVERSTGVSTATNYGTEIATANKDPSIPLHDKAGPYWESTQAYDRKTTYRPLPEHYVLTKTHCGSRCVECRSFYDVVVNVTQFASDCRRTSSYRPGSVHRVEDHTTFPYAAVHLIRNPFTNIVARYHLDRRHMLEEDALLEHKYPNNRTGFIKWCEKKVDRVLRKEPQVAEYLDKLSPTSRNLPCRVEWFQYTQWHTLLLEVIQDMPHHTVHYEDYETSNGTAVLDIVSYLQQSIEHPLRPFRALPTYADHYIDEERKQAQELVKKVASPEAWSLLERYF